MQKLTLLVLVGTLILFIFCSSDQSKNDPALQTGVKFLSADFEETLAMAAQQDKIILMDLYSDG